MMHLLVKEQMDIHVCEAMSWHSAMAYILLIIIITHHLTHLYHSVQYYHVC